MKKLMVCIGTRPEAIKLAPLVLAAKARHFDVSVLISGQHREMLAPFLSFFKIHADHDLSVFKPNQTLPSLTAAILQGMGPILKSAQPDLLFVQGDTTTAFACALAAFYEQVPVAHVEAGLRTFDRYSPFPEEMNRMFVSRIAEYHFAPTVLAKENLAREGITERVFVTGNTGVDALRFTLEKDPARLSESSKMILVTCHRRENHGKPLEHICDALLEILEKHPDARVVFPVHLNPHVQKIVNAKLAGHPRISFISPQGYEEFTALMKQAYLLLTDSGGVQEEAPYLKKPIFVLRESTERPEGIDAGVSVLVGSDSEKIVNVVSRALSDSAFYQSFQRAASPYGDGYAAEKILDLLS